MGDLDRALEQVRKGILDDASWALLERLALRSRPKWGPTEVVPTNKQADAINDEGVTRLFGLAEQSDPVVAFVALPVGMERKEAFVAFGATSAPRRLRLCQGAMLVLTQSVKAGPMGQRLPNGTLCRVTGFVQIPSQLYSASESPIDQSAFNVEERHFLAKHSGRLPRVSPLHQIHGFDDFVLKPVVCSDDDGAVVQLPARLAWALTVHRAQGISLDSAVVHLDGLSQQGRHTLHCRVVVAQMICGSVGCQNALLMVLWKLSSLIQKLWSSAHDGVIVVFQSST